MILLTFLAKCVGISRFTSHVTVSSLFVTRRAIQTVTTTVVNTVVTICSIITYYINNKIGLHVSLDLNEGLQYVGS